MYDACSTTCTDIGIQEVDHTVTLSKCEWDSEPTSIIIEFLLSLFTFLLQ